MTDVITGEATATAPSTPSQSCVWQVDHMATCGAEPDVIVQGPTLYGTGEAPVCGRHLASAQALGWHPVPQAVVG